jgi:hypothetical protein
MIDFEQINEKLTQACIYYEKTAPVVSRWADDLYMRINDNPREVKLGEIIILNQLFGDGGLIPPNYAQNIIYKHLESIGHAEGILSF